MFISCGVCQWSGDLTVEGTPYIHWCPGCQTGLTVPPPARDITSDEVFTIESSYKDRLGDRPQWRHEAEARADWLATCVTTDMLVAEVGSATGEFLEAAQKRSWSIVGIEPSSWAVEEARKICSQETFEGTLSDYIAAHPSMRFDVVALFHTLEHVPNPGGLLTEIRSVLAPNGRVFLEVPNAGILPSTDDGRRWWMRSLTEHVHHFRPESLQRLLVDAGFQHRVWTQDIAAYRPGRPTLGDLRRRLLVERRLRDPHYLLRAEATVA